MNPLLAAACILLIGAAWRAHRRAGEAERRLLMSRALLAGEREARIAAVASAEAAQKRLDDARATMLAVAEATAAAQRPVVAYAPLVRCGARRAITEAAPEHPHQVFGLVVEVICDHMAIPFGYLLPAQQPGEGDRVFVTRWGSA
jgi:hypothetical protein